MKNLNPCTVSFLLSYFYFVVLLQPGCFANDISSDIPPGLADTINVIKDKTKDINRPEDVPVVKEWMDQCKENVGGRMWRTIKSSPKRMVDCFKKHVNFDKVKMEVEESRPKGELDLVLKKYCGRTDLLLNCVDDMLELVQQCLSEKQNSSLYVLREALAAGLNFTCYENGDRIALFMAEEGVECLGNRSEVAKNCLYSKIPELKDAEKDPMTLQIEQDFFDQENCRKITAAHGCLVSATSSCGDPTPANILDSLLLQAIKVTPCAQSAPYAPSASVALYTHFLAILPHCLVLVLSGLTAVHILL